MTRPVAAGVLTIIGGLLILGGGLAFAAIGVLVFTVFGFLSGLFFVGAIVGVIAVLMGILMIAVPSAHVVWGAIAIILAILSIPFALAGIFLGFILALIGGILAIAWKPLPAPPPVPVTEARKV